MSWYGSDRGREVLVGVLIQLCTLLYMSDSLYYQRERCLPICCRLSYFPPVSHHAKQMDWQWRLQRAKNPSMDFRLLLPPRCPLSSPLPLSAPAQSIQCGDFIDSGKGVVIQQSMSVSTELREGRRDRGTEGGRHVAWGSSISVCPSKWASLHTKVHIHAMQTLS